MMKALNLDFSKQHILKVVTAVIILALAGQVNIPLQPVPITLQSLAVLLIGFVLPTRLAVSAVLSYLILGFCGVPVFPGFIGGPALLVCPSAGYFVGFVLAVWAMSSWRASLWLRGALGSVLIYVCGVTVLCFYFGSLSTALKFGLYPFILPGLVKLGILVLLLKYVFRGTDLAH